MESLNHVTRAACYVTPRAAADGQSLGFDPDVLGMVLVDPTWSGGFIVDMSKLGRDPKAFNEAASREGVIGDVSEFYRNVQEPAVELQRFSTGFEYGANDFERAESLQAAFTVQMIQQLKGAL